MPDLQTVRRPLNSGATDAKRAGLFLSSASSAGFTPSYVSFKHDRHTTAESPVFYASRTFLYRRASPQGSGTRDKITRDERTQVPGTRQAASRSLRRPRIPGPRRSDVRAPTFTYVGHFVYVPRRNHVPVSWTNLGSSPVCRTRGDVRTWLGENLVLGLRSRKVSAIARQKGVLSALKREERSPGRAPPPLHADVRRFATCCSPWALGPHF